MDKQTRPRTDDRLAAIVARLTENAAGLRYGTTSVTLKIHDGRITDITFSTTENIREREGANNAPA
ncbi:MAG: YezD family protein [Spirochaetales bacterium]|nr:YezD family protein [Spirochaetales bacterium]